MQNIVSWFKKDNRIGSKQGRKLVAIHGDYFEYIEWDTVQALVIKLSKGNAWTRLNSILIDKNEFVTDFEEFDDNINHKTNIKPFHRSLLIAIDIISFKFHHSAHFHISTCK